MRTRMMILALCLGSFWTSLAFADDKVKVATCNDGKTMYGTNPHEHRGACSGHGGVASWADGSPVKSHVKKTEYK